MNDSCFILLSNTSWNRRARCISLFSDYPLPRGLLPSGDGNVTNLDADITDEQLVAAVKQVENEAEMSDDDLLEAAEQLEHVHKLLKS